MTLPSAQGGRSGLIAAATLVLLGAGLVTGCTDSTPGPSGPAPSAVGPAFSGLTEDPAGVACRRQSRRAARRVGTALWRADKALLASPSGRSAFWTRRLSARLERAQRDVGEACPEPPVPAADFLRVAGSVASEELGLDGMREVLTAYAAWDPKGRRLVVTHDRCRRHRGSVTAEYRPFWAWTDSGRRHWVRLRFTNRTAHPVDGVMRGQVWVTGLPPRLRPRGIPRLHDVQRRAWALTWGGSSADMYVLEARSTSEFLAPVHFAGGAAPSAFRTGPEGAVVEVRMSAEVSYGRRGLTCPVVVTSG